MLQICCEAPGGRPKGRRCHWRISRSLAHLYSGSSGVLWLNTGMQHLTLPGLLARPSQVYGLVEATKEQQAAKQQEVDKAREEVGPCAGLGLVAAGYVRVGKALGSVGWGGGGGNSRWEWTMHTCRHQMSCGCMHHPAQVNSALLTTAACRKLSRHSLTPSPPPNAPPPADGRHHCAPQHHPQDRV